jgi:hypothetical protein
LIDVPVLFGLGLAFVHAVGIDGHLVTGLIAGLALKQAPKGARSRAQRGQKRKKK